MFQGGGYGDQGGGYLSSPAGGNFSSPGASQPEKRPRHRADSIVPCTVSQIIQCKDEGDSKLIINNVELYQVTVVGIVRKVSQTATRLEYEIDDMTGPPLDVKHFLDTDQSMPDDARVLPARENTYVRVSGHLRVFEGKRNMTAFKIEPLTDMNEVTSHMLEVVYKHMYLSNKNSGGLGKGIGQQAVGFTAGGNTAAPTNFSLGASSGPDQGLTPSQRQVYSVIKSVSDEQGVSFDYICTSLRGLPPKMIRVAIEFLSAEGHVYSTIDDDHYRSTDS